MPIIDLHCDTITRCAAEHVPLCSNSFHIDLDKLRQGNSLAQIFAIYILTNNEAEEYHMEQTPYEYYQYIYSYYKEQLECNRDYIVPMYSLQDMCKNAKEGKISSLLSIEDGVVIGDSMERLHKLYEDGVRLITLTWNYENAIGYPHSMNTQEMKLGLKPFGIDLIGEMNRLGMIIDVSHLSEGGFYDVARLSKKPFIASHSCARALCNHSRNLSDEQLKTIGNCGGVVGINYYSRFLKESSPEKSWIQDVAEHARYIADHAGIEAVALGSDYDGIECSLEWNNYSGTTRVLDALSKSFSSHEIDMISYQNASRIFREVL